MSKSTMRELLVEKLRKPRDVIPPGFLTAEEWREKLHIQPMQLRRALSELVVEGKVEGRKFLGEDDARPVMRYREK